ncbi:DNA-3-methyladenine glycosylase I [Aestuariivirga sp.]|uniref:DNA-3-methyladenine glycosylase I n=1 Tax=Aestuariivirga sp. TaxID=2650926 RepID=UPI0039E25BAB
MGAIKHEDGLHRCTWCGTDPVYVAYHDTEWGVPEYDSRALFEKLLLDGFQAGLSWITILRKRDNFRAAFDGFDPEKMARYTPQKLERLMNDPGIVRNRLKIEASVSNARAYLAIPDFSAYLWGYLDGKPLVNSRKGSGDIPAKTELAEKISKDLQKRGFRFVGPTIVYAFMQACGLVNDHLVDCYCYSRVGHGAHKA